MAHTDEASDAAVLDSVLAEEEAVESGFNSLKNMRGGKPLNLPLKVTITATGAVSQWQKGCRGAVSAEVRGCWHHRLHCPAHAGDH